MLSICLICSKFAESVIRYLQEKFPELFPTDVNLELHVLDVDYSSFLTSRVLYQVIDRLLQSKQFDFVVLPRVEGIRHVRHMHGATIVSLKHVSDVPALLWYLKYEHDIPDSVVEFEQRLAKYTISYR